jgi:hypothetical protein
MSTPEHHLIGKPVTVVYEITDPVEWRKTNPLNYTPHGMKAYCVSMGDLSARNEQLREALERIAEEGERYEGDIARDALKADNKR